MNQSVNIWYAGLFNIWLPPQRVSTHGLRTTHHSAQKQGIRVQLLKMPEICFSGFQPVILLPTRNTCRDAKSTRQNQGGWNSPTNVLINNLQVSGASTERLFHLNDEDDQLSQAFIQQMGIKAFGGPFDNILFVSSLSWSPPSPTPVRLLFCAVEW